VTFPPPHPKDGSPGPTVDDRPCVLFVDDEDAVRRLGARALKGAGFDVLLAADGVEAVECFQAQHSQISVVVIDMTMPRMTGIAAAQEMRRISPNVPVVLSTGFACDETSHGIPGVAAMLQKPYRIHVLVETIRDVLARGSLSPNKLT
jgi:two-component system cell cycle sensor histidine kinase/response regulator CckA